MPAARSTSLAALAHCTESHSERDVQRLSDKYGLKLPIPISQTPVGDFTVPFLKMRHWAEFIESRNLWHMLCGLDRADHDACDRRWKLFWERYQRINPGHEVFQRAARGEIDLCKTAGLLLHGDEGRSLKKSAILVVSCHSVLGYGLSTSSKAKKAETNKLNFEQPTWTTRYLLSVLPKSYYSEESGGDECFQQLLAAVAGDLRDLYDHGTVGPWGRHFYCIINIVGDWPWMVKSGLLGRSFQNVAKHGRPSAKAKAAPKGICHQCLADYGRDGVVWEDFESEVPDWVSTMNQVSPFLDTPAVLVLPHDHADHASLFSWDIFHGWHLGSGKIFLASAFVCILISDIFEGSVETRLDALNTHYWTWCKNNHKRPIKKFTRAGLNWLTSSAYPSGAWSKGDATTQLMKFFLTFCRDYLGQVRANALLSLAFQAGEAMDECLRLLFSFELWVPANAARGIASKGLAFLRLNGRAARLAYDSQLRLFLFMPNLHRLHHIWVEVRRQSQITEFVMSPLYASCQADEDYIGRPSRLSRRVSARATILRTLQRSLQAAYAKYVETGHIIPGS